MKVRELIDRLKKCHPDQNVVMCMDWTVLPEKDRPSKEQWEDDLGDLGFVANEAHLSVYLLNKNFK
jgi:hypothetical protein